MNIHMGSVAVAHEDAVVRRAEIEVAQRNHNTPSELEEHGFRWTVRASKVFRKLRIYTLAKLCNTTEAKLLNTRNCGISTVNHIKKQLFSRGLSLKPPTIRELNRKKGWTEERRKEQSERAIALNIERRKGRWHRRTMVEEHSEQPEPEPEPEDPRTSNWREIRREVQASVDMIEEMRAALAITNKGSLQLAEEYLEAMQGDLTSAIFILKMLRGETP